MLNCLFVCSLQVVRILGFLHGLCDVHLQFNKQARHMKLLSNHILKMMHIIPFALKECALICSCDINSGRILLYSWARISALK